MNATYKVAVSNMVIDHKIPPGSTLWPAFNTSFENRELESGQVLQVIYDGKPITTWHKDNWRTSANYICGQYLGLDFDHGSTLIQLVADKFVARYSSFIYTTMSHSEAEPRFRVIFFLDEPIMQAKNYSLASSALLWMFGTADRACKDAVRFWYGSPKCEFEYFDQVLPLDIVKKLIANYEETGKAEHRKATRPDYYPPASQQEVSDALRMIPPWGIDYLEWLSILMALHQQFGEDGYGLAQSWGDGKGDEIERKWKGFKEAGNSSGTITIATIFGIAKRFGYRKNMI